MKPKEIIEDRLLKLKNRHRRLYVLNNTVKEPHNCKYNYEHIGNKLSYKNEIELDISPRKSNSIVILNEDKPIRLCMYGSEDPLKWSGNICDDSTVSSKCSLFISLKDTKELEDEFDSIIMDDKQTIVTYPDIASLQWVLDNRVWKLKNGLMFYVKLFFISFFYYIKSIVRKNVNNS